jgi:RNA polymerase-associated protein RTF1
MNRRGEKRFKIGEFEYTESELYENEEDRNRINSMSELDRERILDDRIKKLLERKEREAVLMKQSTDLGTNRRKDALQDIKKKRSERRDRQEGIRVDHDMENVSSISSDSESGEIEDENDYSSSSYRDHSDDSKRNRRKYKRSRSRSRSSSDDEVLSFESGEKKKKEATLTLQDIERMKVTRSFLEKYWEIPIFDQSVLGCFVRINYLARSTSSSSYFLAQIKRIIENKDKPYNLGNKQCTKYIIIEHDQAEKPLGFNIVSNSPINEVEFRQWKDRMEKFKHSLPSMETVKRCMENLEKVKTYVYSKEQFEEMINKKKDLKIQRQDKRMNITYELALVSEEYNSAKQKYEESKNEQYLMRMNELKPKLDSLMKMAQEREKDELNRAEVDTAALINRRNKEKQRLNDLKHSLINRKKNRNDPNINPYKRRDCRPMNLFDSGYLKKTEEKNESEEKEITEQKQDLKEINIEFTPQFIYERKRQLMQQVKGAFVDVTKDLDEIYHKKKENLTENKKDDNKFIFDVLGLNKAEVAKLINIHNSRFHNEQFKVITLDELDY